MNEPIPDYITKGPTKKFIEEKTGEILYIKESGESFLKRHNESWL
jgi:hypothetical protein